MLWVKCLGTRRQEETFKSLLETREYVVNLDYGEFQFGWAGRGQETKLLSTNQDGEYSQGEPGGNSLSFIWHSGLYSKCADETYRWKVKWHNPIWISYKSSDKTGEATEGMMLKRLAEEDVEESWQLGTWGNRQIQIFRK